MRREWRAGERQAPRGRTSARTGEAAAVVEGDSEKEVEAREAEYAKNCDGEGLAPADAPAAAAAAAGAARGSPLVHENVGEFHAALREEIFGSSALFEEPASADSEPEHNSKSKSPAAVTLRDSKDRMLERLADCSHGDETQRWEALKGVADLLETQGRAIDVGQTEHLRDVLMERLWTEPEASLQACIVRLLTSLIDTVGVGRLGSSCLQSDAVSGMEREEPTAKRARQEEHEVVKEHSFAMSILRELLRFLAIKGGGVSETLGAGDQSSLSESSGTHILGAACDSEVVCQILWSVKLFREVGVQVNLSMLTCVVKLLACGDFAVRQLAIEALQESCTPGPGKVQGGLTFSSQAEYLAGKLHWFIQDTVPAVKIAAINAVRELCANGAGFQYAFYKQAVAVLNDPFDGVRLAALKLVAAWVRFMLKEQQIEAGIGSPEANEAFLHVSSMATDMNMRVRQATFMELRTMPVAGLSVPLLLQTLSKRVAKLPPTSSSGTMAQSQGVGEIRAGEEGPFKVKMVVLESFAAGAFVHGLEDEFWEVRTEALAALAALCCRCPAMVEPAVVLIVDAINDDNAGVRMRALEALLLMAENSPLRMTDDQLHSVCGVMDDASREMRRLSRKDLGSLHVVKRAALQNIVHALVGGLKSKLQEEEMGAMEALSSVGLKHSSLVECVAEDFIRQARSAFAGDGGIAEPVYRALLVLLASACRSGGSLNSLLPQSMWDHLLLLGKKLPPGIRSFVESTYSLLRNQQSTSRPKGDMNIDLSSKLFDSQPRKSVEFPEPISTVTADFEAARGVGIQGVGLAFVERWEGGLYMSTIGGDAGVMTEEERSQCALLSLELGLGEGVQEPIVRALAAILQSAWSGARAFTVKGEYHSATRLLRDGCRLLRKMVAIAPEVAHAARFAALQLRILIVIIKSCHTIRVGKRHVDDQLDNLAEDVNADVPHLRQNPFPCQSCRRATELEAVVGRMEGLFRGLSVRHKLQILELKLLGALMREGCQSHLKKPSLEGRHLRERLSIGFETEEDSNRKYANVLNKVRSYCEDHHLRPSPPVAEVMEGLVKMTGRSRAFKDILASYWPVRPPFAEHVREIWGAIVDPHDNPDHPLDFFLGLPIGIAFKAELHNLRSSDVVSVELEFPAENRVEHRFLDCGGTQNVDCEGGSCTDAAGTDERESVKRVATTVILVETPQVSTFSLRLSLVLVQRSANGEWPEVNRRVEERRRIGVGLCGPREVHFVAKGSAWQASGGRGSK